MQSCSPCSYEANLKVTDRLCIYSCMLPLWVMMMHVKCHVRPIRFVHIRKKKNVLPKLSYYMPDIEADRAIDAKENVLCMNDK
jgi:hypothetical protein